MEILLALGAAVSCCVSVFVGGALTRRARVFIVFLVSQLVSLVVLLVAVAVKADGISWPGFGWGNGWAGGCGGDVHDL